MRILQVNKFNYIRGGAEKYFIEISKNLEELGHQVAIFLCIILRIILVLGRSILFLVLVLMKLNYVIV